MGCEVRSMLFARFCTLLVGLCACGSSGDDTADGRADVVDDEPLLIVDAGADSPAEDSATQCTFCTKADASAVCPPTEPAEGEPCGCGRLICEWGACPKSVLGECHYGKWFKQPFDCGSKCPLSFDGGGSPCMQFDPNCESSDGWCACWPDGENWTWLCKGPDAGCPISRPPFGSQCAPTQTTCLYPPLPCRYGVICQCGFWQPGQPCPD